MCVLRKIIWRAANVSLLITRSNQYFLGCIPDSLDLIDDDSCVSIKYLNYWSSEMSSVTIKSRIKSYLLFYLYVFDEGTPEARIARKRKAVISNADIVLRGIGEPSQFRGAICSFAFLHRNVRHSAVRLARRTCFRLQQVYREDSATPFHTCT